MQWPYLFQYSKIQEIYQENPVNKNVKIAIPVIIFVVVGIVILIGIETNMPSDEIIDSAESERLRFAGPFWKRETGLEPATLSLED